LKKLLSLIAFSILLLVPAGIQDAFTHGNVDQSFTGPYTQTAGVHGFFDKSGQTFVPTASNLVGVDVFAAPSSGPGGSELMTITIWQDELGGAGIILDSVTQTVDTTGANLNNPVTLHFDFSPDVQLIAGNTYALQFLTVTPIVSMAISCNGLNEYDDGIAFQSSNPLAICDWGFVTYFEEDEVVGGEFLPIETTSLILAGAQSFSWMIPLVLSGIGIGLFVVSRKSENS